MALPATVIDLPSPEEVQVVNQTGVVAATDNGHTIQVNAPTGETLAVGGDVYSLVQFHFHAPSEHTVNGEHYPMEMHFVHASQDGRLAVMGFFVEEGMENQGLAPLWARLPHGNGAEATVPVSAELANHILPGKGPIWYYSGSLTTPPCSEGVSWFVRKDPIQMSSAQIKEFTDVYSHNNRPVQDLNDRKLHTDINPDVTYK
jgi:carbonic anhydrase